MLKSNDNTQSIVQKIGPFIGLLLIVIVISVMSPNFLTINNIFNVLRQVSINALIAFGMTFVILTGGIDLSVGSILALTGAVTAGMLASGMDPILAMGLGLLLGAILGAVNGIIIAKGKVAPFIVFPIIRERLFLWNSSSDCNDVTRIWCAVLHFKENDVWTTCLCSWWK